MKFDQGDHDRLRARTERILAVALDGASDTHWAIAALGAATGALFKTMPKPTGADACASFCRHLLLDVAEGEDG